MLAGQLDGADVMTIEGLAPEGELHPLQHAFRDRHAFQCGFCTPGFVMAAVEMLQRTRRPTEAEVREAIAGNVCRCTGYQSIVEGILLAAERGFAPTPQPTPARTTDERAGDSDRATSAPASPGSKTLASLPDAPRYVGDLQRPKMLEAAFVRSPIAHGRIVSVDVRALAMPGVVAVITGRDVESGTAPFTMPMETPGVTRPAFYALSAERVRHVGDPVAIVIAENRYLAEDAREAVHVEYEQLPPVLWLADAEADGPAMYAELDSNVLHRDVRSFGDPDAAFAAADVVVRHSVRLPRLLHSPMDTRGGLAEYDAATRQLVFHTTSQSPHLVWLTLAETLRHPFERITVLVPDMGGAFGQKAHPQREDVALCYAARRLGRPVRWIEDRTASLTAAPSGRGEQLDVAAAVRRDGTIMALEGSVVFDHGAYLVPFPTHLQAALIRTVLPAAYRIEHLRFAQVHLLTNRPMWAPLRAPWAIEALARETLIDEVARELALDPADVRRRNFVAYDEQPYVMVSGPTLEGFRAVEAFDCALDAIGYEELRREQAAARSEGRLLGIGLASYIEPAPGPPDLVPALDLHGVLPERMSVRLEPDASLTVFTSQIPHGQGHETTLSQVAADALGLPLERIKVEWGDTRTTPFNPLGTGGSRAGAMSRGRSSRPWTRCA